MPSLHASISPSASHRWINCPPSVRLNQKYRDIFGDQSSEYAEEGTKAHSVAELKLRKENKEINEFNYNSQISALGEIPSEMDRATNDYVDVVLGEFYSVKKNCPDAKLMVEQQIDMQEGIKGCWGTSDAVIVSDQLLVVCDLKYGKGLPVSAVNNPQARIYAYGAALEFGDLYGFTHVKTVIIQPRLDSVTEDILTREELFNWVSEVATPSAELAYKGEGEFHAGDWCRFCAVKALCKENVLAGFEVLRNIFDSPDTISDDRINAVLPYLDRAEDWIKNVRDYARSMALEGHEWKGYKLVRGRRPGRKWKDENEVINTLARAGYSQEQYMTEPELRSCSELEKILKKSAFDALVGQYVFQGDGALTLVPEDDKREAYSPIELSFGDLLGNNDN